ncbi:recombinase family protein [Vibrio vulnificus]|nr:recombinase family protein [Vibrio vulnificus]
MKNPAIYIYRRVSSERQVKKSGLDIQVSDRTLSMLQKAHPNHSIVELGSDEGLSGYSGKHLIEGVLGRFIEDVEQGRIAKGSILAIFNLDRLSRLKLGDTYKKIFIPLVDNGVSIYSENEGRFFSNQDVDFVLASFIFSRAHNESATKTKRNFEVVLNACKKWEEHKQFTPNLTSAPFWIDNSTGQFNHLADAAREAIEMLCNGVGLKTISQYMQEKYPTKPKRVTSKASTFWTQETIHKLKKAGDILLGDKSVSLKGDENLNIKPFKTTLKGYYPALIDYPTYNRLKGVRTSKRKVLHGMIYLLSDLKLFKCGDCGYAILATSNTSQNRAKYFCGGAATRKSSHVNFKADVETIERIVLLMIGGLIDKGVKRISDNDYEATLNRMDNEVELLEGKLKELGESYLVNSSSTILSLINTVESQLMGVKEQREHHVNQKVMNSYAVWDMFKLYTNTPFTDLKDERRNEVRDTISNLCKSVTLSPNKQNNGWIIEVVLRDGRQATLDTFTLLSHKEYTTISEKMILPEIVVNDLYHYMLRVKNSYTMKPHIERSENLKRVVLSSEFYPSHPRFMDKLVSGIVDKAKLKIK